MPLQLNRFRSEQAATASTWSKSKVPTRGWWSSSLFLLFYLLICAVKNVLCLLAYLIGSAGKAIYIYLGYQRPIECIRKLPSQYIFTKTRQQWKWIQSTCVLGPWRGRGTDGRADCFKGFLIPPQISKRSNTLQYPSTTSAGVLLPNVVLSRSPWIRVYIRPRKIRASWPTFVDFFLLLFLEKCVVYDRNCLLPWWIYGSISTPDLVHQSWHFFLSSRERSLESPATKRRKRLGKWLAVVDKHLNLILLSFGRFCVGWLSSDSAENGMSSILVTSAEHYGRDRRKRERERNFLPTFDFYHQQFRAFAVSDVWHMESHQ